MDDLKRFFTLGHVADHVRGVTLKGGAGNGRKLVRTGDDGTIAKEVVPSGVWTTVEETEAVANELNDRIDGVEDTVTEKVVEKVSDRFAPKTVTLHGDDSNDSNDEEVELSGLAVGNYDTIQGHVHDLENPHSVTKAQVGLGNADDTSDMDKPVSTATQEALDELGRKLSTVFRFMGSVDDYSDLPLDGNRPGDVYNIKKDGMNVVWVENGSNDSNDGYWDDLGASLEGYATKEEVRFEAGAGTDSAVQKQSSDAVIGLPVGPNSSVSTNSVAEGAGNVAGLRGYRYTDTGAVGNSLTFSVEPDGWAVGDVVSVINKSKYPDAGVIASIDGKTVTFESELNIGATFVEESDFDSKCAYVSAKPDKGDVDLGAGSHAEGVRTRAVNTVAHAEGRDTAALGQYSHAEGRGTSAQYIAHAEGHGSVASGMTSHAEGNSTTASGDNSHSEGTNTAASGVNAHSENYGTAANGANSHAEGAQSATGGNAKPAPVTNFTNTGYAAHAEGNGTWATGNSSHAEGYSTVASALAAHAEGNQTVASGQNSHASGLKSIAEGYASTAMGRSAYAMHDRSFVWAGWDSDIQSKSNGAGSFTVNPAPANASTDPATGFYIGERSLAEILNEKADKNQIPDVPVKAVKRNGAALIPDTHGAVDVEVPTSFDRIVSPDTTTILSLRTASRGATLSLAHRTRTIGNGLSVDRNIEELYAGVAHIEVDITATPVSYSGTMRLADRAAGKTTYHPVVESDTYPRITMFRILSDYSTAEIGVQHYSGGPTVIRQFHGLVLQTYGDSFTVPTATLLDIPLPTDLSDNTPFAPSATPSPGTSRTASRSDHVHPVDTSRMPADATGEDIVVSSASGVTIASEIETITDAVVSNADAVTAINGKIPSAASASNQLADKKFVTDSITQGTAVFRGSFASKAALDAVQWQTTDPSGANFVSNNDYAVVRDDETHSDECWRYLYVVSSGSGSWTAQYMINESPLTQAQQDALNSGVTAAVVAKANSAVQPGDLSSVATTGSYNDLSNKPTIPTSFDRIVSENESASVVVNDDGTATLEVAGATIGDNDPLSDLADYLGLDDNATLDDVRQALGLSENATLEDAVQAVPAASEKTIATLDDVEPKLDADQRNIVPYAASADLTLDPEVAVYRLSPTGTAISIPSPVTTALPATDGYYQFEIELAVPATATSLTAPSGWTWLTGFELPSSGYAGKTVYVSCRMDLRGNAVTASCWRVA